MKETFLNVPAEEILARLRAAVAQLGVTEINLGGEVHGFCNVGVTLPKKRRSAHESRELRQGVSAALTAAGVLMAENALAPKVGGDLRGQVWVRDVPRPVAMDSAKPRR